MDQAIEIRGLSKRYLIGHLRRERYQSLRDVVAHGVRGLLERARHPLSPNREKVDLEEFWALDGVDLNVQQGERVAIIGRNGAGKSTLLKLLSRITEPSAGSFSISGRVASLLEVGAGFHPELTGRENIYLNGAILGMTRKEIMRKFDDIVAFAEVERFLDTPVKRYSSGMYVRLAFAVGASMEPDVLIVDEVLAVGDAAFQKKCIGRLDAVGREGRTVLFVSHNMQAVRALCDRAIVLERGRVYFDGTVPEALEAYRAISAPVAFNAKTAVSDEKRRRGSGAVRFKRIEVRDQADCNRLAFTAGEPVRFYFEYEVFDRVPELLFGLILKCPKTREQVTGAFHWLSNEALEPGATGSATIEVDTSLLHPNEYILYFWFGDQLRQSFDTVDDVINPIYVGSAETTEGGPPAGQEPAGYFKIATRII